jgi:hypothetical protein
VTVPDADLVARLQIRPGTRLLLLAAPPGYRERIEPLPGGGTTVESAAPDEAFDVIHAFCRDRAAVAALASTAIGAYRAGGIMLLSYPKGGATAGTDLDRDSGWEPFTRAGFRPVRQVSIDEDWSAMRWRRVEEVSVRVR